MLRSLLALATAVTLASIAAPSHAASADPDVERLARAGHSLKWNSAVPGHAARHGHAEVLINASADRVLQTVTDFGHYKDLIPEKFHNAHVVGQNGPTTDVYMQVPVMHGFLTLTETLRFGAPHTEGNVTTVEGTFVRGNNVKDAHVLFTVRAVDPNFTVLKFDLLLVPSMPAPQSAVDEELRDAALQAVDRLHDRAQGNARTVAYTASN